MEDTRRMSVLTNIVYVLTDVLETNLLDMKEAADRHTKELELKTGRSYSPEVRESAATLLAIGANLVLSHLCAIPFDEALRELAEYAGDTAERRERP